jgi:hypothetical protein
LGFFFFFGVFTLTSDSDVELSVDNGGSSNKNDLRTKTKKALTEFLYTKGHPRAIAAINRIMGDGVGGAGTIPAEIKLPRRLEENFNKTI